MAFQANNIIIFTQTYTSYLPTCEVGELIDRRVFVPPAFNALYHSLSTAPKRFRHSVTREVGRKHFSIYNIDCLIESAFIINLKHFYSFLKKYAPTTIERLSIKIFSLLSVLLQIVEHRSNDIHVVGLGVKLYAF